MVHVCNSGKHVFPDGQSARASACCANFVHVCISGRHRCPDIQSAKASACCASFERTGDKDELLRQQKAQEETVNASEKSTSKCAEEIASRQKLLAELEDSLAQAKAKRNETLASGQIPESDSALASLPSDIESLKDQIQKKQDELSSIQGKQRSAAERLSEIRRELAKIEAHAKRDSLYVKMMALIQGWNDCAALLEQLRKDAGYTGSAANSLSDVATGEFAVLPPDMVRFEASGRPALKAIGLRADVDPSQMGARFGMFL